MPCLWQIFKKGFLVLKKQISVEEQKKGHAMADLEGHLVETPKILVKNALKLNFWTTPFSSIKYKSSRLYKDSG